MNNRIKELTEESGLWVMMQAFSDEFGNSDVEGDCGTELEKFADLIVRECLDVVALRLYLGTEEICRQECNAVASEIKEYFGVE